MNKVLLMALVMAFAVRAEAALFGVGKADFNAYKSETNNQIANQKNDISAVKLDNGAALARLEMRIGKIETDLSAQVSAVAGFKNDVSNLSSGRDTIQTTTNDSDMIIKIFNKVANNWYLVAGAFFTFLLSLMAGVWAVLKYQASMFYKQLAEKDKMIERERDSRARKEKSLDEWQSSFIEKLNNRIAEITNGKPKSQGG